MQFGNIQPSSGPQTGDGCDRNVGVPAALLIRASLKALRSQLHWETWAGWEQVMPVTPAPGLESPVGSGPDVRAGSAGHFTRSASGY